MKKITNHSIWSQAVQQYGIEALDVLVGMLRGSDKTFAFKAAETFFKNCFQIEKDKQDTSCSIDWSELSVDEILEYKQRHDKAFEDLLNLKKSQKNG